MKTIAALFLFPVIALAQADSPPPFTVTTARPIVAHEARSYEIPGRTEAYETARLATRATGVISERRYDIGDRVKADEIVALVEAPEIDHAVEAARAALLQAQAKARNARQFADRASQLHQQRAISREDYESRSFTLEEAEAAVAEARAQLARLEAQQSFATIRAPFDGVIAARNFDRGDHVRGDAAAGQAWLYQLVRLDKLRFSVNASSDIALRLASGTDATIAFREFPGQHFEAKVERSSRVFDPASGTMRVELLLDNPDLSLPAGLTGTAAFLLQPLKGTFLIPTNALILKEGSSKLAIVVEGKVAFVEVLTGRNFGAQVEALSPELTEESAVIINPNAMLKAGDEVGVNTSAPKNQLAQKGTAGK